jgi:hypothetical protein
MLELKLIPPDDQELDEMITRLEIKWSKKSVTVSVERAEPMTTVDMADITGNASYQGCISGDCNECTAMVCTVECQRLRRIARAQEQVEADEDALACSTARLREAVLHG